MRIALCNITDVAEQGRVIVIGAGIVGAAIARSLVRSGTEVVVLDRGPSAGGTSSGGEGNLLVSDKGPGPELELMQRSIQLWSEIGPQLRDELPAGFPGLELEHKGGLVVATTEAGAVGLGRFAVQQRTAGVVAEEVGADRVRELEPDLTRNFVTAVLYPQDAQVQPVVATESLLASARQKGAQVRQGVEVLGPVLSKGRLTGVRTSDGVVNGDAVVVAAGPWSGQVAAALGAPVPVKPRRGTVLVTTRMPQRVWHKVYDADYVGAVGSGAADLQVSSVVESTAAGTVLIGSSREQRGFDDRIEARVLAALAAKALLLFPFLKDVAVMRAYGGFRPFMPDHLPLIGPDPRLAGLWHATGHEGAGIGLSLGTAEVLSQHLLGAAPAAENPFRVDRPSLRPHLEDAA
nr:FAD-dependent oxidoreductase [Kineosporia rhizophila]